MQLAKVVDKSALVLAVREEELPEVIHTLLSVNWRQYSTYMSMYSLYNISGM